MNGHGTLNSGVYGGSAAAVVMLHRAGRVWEEGGLAIASMQGTEGFELCAVIAIRGTLSAEDLITDFMCEPADMDDWMSTAATPHSGQGHGSHDPKGLVGSSQGTGFFSRHSSAQKRTAGITPGHAQCCQMCAQSWHVLEHLVAHL